MKGKVIGSWQAGRCKPGREQPQAGRGKASLGQTTDKEEEFDKYGNWGGKGGKQEGTQKASKRRKLPDCCETDQAGPWKLTVGLLLQVWQWAHVLGCIDPQVWWGPGLFSFFYLVLLI